MINRNGEEERIIRGNIDNLFYFNYDISKKVMGISNLINNDIKNITDFLFFF